MSQRQQEQGGSIVEPLNLKQQARDRSHVADTKQEYDRILQRLDSKIKKPLHDLRTMIEVQIQRIKNGQ